MFQFVAETFGHLILAGQQNSLPVLIPCFHGHLSGPDGASLHFLRSITSS